MPVCHKLGLQAHRMSPCTFVMREPTWVTVDGVYHATQESAQEVSNKLMSIMLQMDWEALYTGCCAELGTGAP
eukprot:315606-Amphidinium_carterae.2